MVDRHNGTYDPTVLGSNPKLTIYTFSIYSQISYFICHCVENWSKVNKKGLG